MFKVVFLVKRREGMSREAYQAYSTERHAPIVAGLPGIRRYVVNYSQVGPADDEPAYDGIVELWFDHQGDFETALASERGQQALADQPNFLDVSRTVMLPVSESTVV